MNLLVLALGSLLIVSNSNAASPECEQAIRTVRELSRVTGLEEAMWMMDRSEASLLNVKKDTKRLNEVETLAKIACK